MGSIPFLSLFSAREGVAFAQSEGFSVSDDIASGFGDSSASAEHLGRRHSDVRRLHRSPSVAHRWLVVLLLLAAFAGATAVFWAMGYVRGRTVLVLLGLVAALSTVFLLVFRRGWNQKVREKRLKLPIVVCMLASMLVLVYLDPAMQMLLTPFTFVVLAYGMYRISRNAAFLLALGVVLGYALVVALHYAEQDNLALLKLEFMQFLALAAALPGFVYLTGKVPLLHKVLNRASRKLRSVEADAQRDLLLGCYNRRYIVAALEAQKQLADETGLPLCMAILDLDHFKRINDEMGHLGGDEVLRTFARVAQQSVRDEDIFGRYGGEEFLLIFPQTSLLPALNTCERVRSQVEAHAWEEGMRCRVSVSIGVTQYVQGESVLEFFSRADTATYLAKEGGRNQVVVEEPVDRSAPPGDAGQHPGGELGRDSLSDEDDFSLVEEAGFGDVRRSRAG